MLYYIENVINVINKCNSIYYPESNRDIASDTSKRFYSGHYTNKLVSLKKRGCLSYFIISICPTFELYCLLNFNV